MSWEKTLLNPDFRDILSTFNDEGVEYLIVGAYALAIHGVPRATADLDIWVNPTGENAERVFRALSNFGAPLDDVAVADFTTPDLVLQIGVAPHRIDVLSSITGIDFKTAWNRRLVVEVDGLSANVLSREDQITNKRAVGRPQDLADAERLAGGKGLRE